MRREAGSLLTSNRVVVSALIIIAITFIVFSGVLKNDFVNWDDDVYIYENPNLQTLASGDVLWTFTHPYYNSWIPLTMLSHGLDYRLWGIAPSGHHLTNLILHALNAGWVFLLGTLLLLHVYGGTESGHAVMRTDANSSILLAGGSAALLFSLHPLRVESVAWVSDRKDLLCTFFALPTFSIYILYSARRGTPQSRRWYVVALLLFTAALMSKSIAVTVPIVFFLIDVLLLEQVAWKGDYRHLLIEKIPFLLLSLGTAVIAWNVAPSKQTSDMFTVLSSMERVLLPFYNLFFYVSKTFWPLHLAAMYPSAGAGTMFISLFLVLVITVVCLILAHRHNRVFFLAWLYYIILSAPSIVLFSAVIQTTADRYAYLPTIGFFLLFACGAERMFRHDKEWLWIGLLVVIALFGLLSMSQVPVWRDSETLWRNVLRNSPGIPLPYNNLGLALQNGGDLDGATESFERAIQLKPDYAEAHLNLGNVKLRIGNVDEAIALYRKAIDISPNLAEAYNNLGVASYGKGDFDTAISSLAKAIQLKPDYGDAYYALGTSYLKRGDTAAAFASLEHAARLGDGRAQDALKRTGRPW
jgi:protein O-mannosyl-transferase